jgi:two-component system sensor histidine kinase BaeS
MLTFSPKRWPLAARAGLYALTTMIFIGAAQWWVLGPKSALEVAVIVAPALVCSTITFVIARQIVITRAKGLLEVYRRFRLGQLEEAIPLKADPEFRESREVFIKLARELHLATRELELRDAERRRLFSDVVHELGTPVSSLLGLAEALERPEIVDRPHMRQRIVRAALGESDRLARFVEDLRDLAQLDDPAMTLHREPVDLALVARDTIERLNAIPDTTTVELRARSAPVSVDPSRIEQIFVNLVKNARRYALPPARIVVTVAPIGEGASIVVEDGGPGVDEADLPKLGERMRRLDRSRARKTGGTGLGLSIVGAVAEKHGGKVRYGRSPLGGLSVTIELDGPPSRRSSGGGAQPA